MNENERDSEIKVFLNQENIPLEDKDFSSRVLYNLPNSKRNNIIIYLFLTLGIALNLILGSIQFILMQFSILLNSLNQLKTPNSSTLIASIALIIIVSILAKLYSAKQHLNL